MSFVCQRTMFSNFCRPNIALHTRLFLRQQPLSRQVIRNKSHNSSRHAPPSSKSNQYSPPSSNRLQPPSPSASPSEINEYLLRLGPEKTHLLRRLNYTVNGKKYVLWSLIAANCAVFGASVYCKTGNNEASMRRRDPGYDPSNDTKQWLSQLLRRYFVLDTSNQSSDRWLSLFGSTFMHVNLIHLAVNMFSLQAIAQMFYLVPISTPTFATLLLGSGLSGSVIWLYSARNSNERQRAAGASGIVSGVVTSAAMLWPRAKLNYFFFKAPLWLVALGFFAYDSYNLNNPNSIVGHAAHLGGAGFGAAFYMLFLRRYARAAVAFY